MIRFAARSPKIDSPAAIPLGHSFGGMVALPVPGSAGDGYGNHCGTESSARARRLLVLAGGVVEAG